MGNINPAYKDRIRYTLIHDEYGAQVITEPLGWRSDEKEYSRNKNYHGIFSKFSNSLRFIDDGADFIKIIYEIYGINAELRLIRDEKHPHTDVWTRGYSGFLDLSTYTRENNQISVKFNSSGLEQNLKARESEKVEIERLDTIDGVPISPLSTKKVLIEGQRIFLKSDFDIEIANNVARMSNFTNGNTRGQTVGVPLNLRVNSHQNAQSVTPNTQIKDDTHERLAGGDIGNMFFVNSDKPRKLKLKSKIKFRPVVERYDDINFSKFWYRLSIYKDGADFHYKSGDDIFFTDNIRAFDNQLLTFNFDKDIELDSGDSMSLNFGQLLDGENGHRANLDITCKDIECDLVIEEDSQANESVSKVVLPFELGERLAHIITGKNNIFYSKALGRTDLGYAQDGLASLTGLAHGFWIRGFDKHPEPKPATSSNLEVVNKYKGFSTSFKDFQESFSTVWNLGLGIERIGYTERIRMESMEYFYNPNVTIRLPNQVQKLKRSVAKEYYYSGIDIGYEKGWENEEAMGLDEYNIRTKYQTVITRVKNNYNKVSKYLAGVYAREFVRRKPKSEYSTTDHKYDKEIFLFDLKRYLGDTFKERKWQDDFEKEPTGVFRPDTATNLRFSPLNLLLRHGWVIASGLTKYALDYINYGSSEGNSALKTKSKNQNEFTENGRVINGELQKPRFVPEWLEFEHEVDFVIIQHLEGSTIINGESIPNFNGLVEFIDDEKEIQKGFLFNLKPNGKGKWKLLKANR